MFMVNNMGKKTFKTIDEQIEILKQKGLVISDIEKTRQIQKKIKG